MLRSHIYLLLMVPSKIQSSSLLFILTLRASSSSGLNVLSSVAAVRRCQVAGWAARVLSSISGGLGMVTAVAVVWVPTLRSSICSCVIFFKLFGAGSSSLEHSHLCYKLPVAIPISSLAARLNTQSKNILLEKTEQNNNRVVELTAKSAVYFVLYIIIR